MGIPDPFDPATLKLAGDVVTEVKTWNGLPRKTAGELFFGPVPMGWAERAAALPGRAWHLACALWFDANCSRGKPATVQPTRRTLLRFGLSSRPTLYRALDVLEGAGLIRVETRDGRRPLVTILPVPKGGK